jgi:hypothetical protein
MDIDRLKQLIEQRERIDDEIREVAGGAKKEKQPRKCSICQSDLHSARTCPDKPKD